MISRSLLGIPASVEDERGDLVQAVDNRRKSRVKVALEYDQGGETEGF